MSSSENRPPSPLPVLTTDAYVNYVPPKSMASVNYFLSSLEGDTKRCIIQRSSIEKTTAYIIWRNFRWFYFDVDSPISAWVDAGVMESYSIIRFCPFIKEPSKYPDAVVKVGDYMFMEWEYTPCDILREFGSLRSWFVAQDAKAFGNCKARPACMPGLSIVVDGTRIAHRLSVDNVYMVSKNTDPALRSRLASAVPMKRGAAAMWESSVDSKMATAEDAVVDAENNVVHLSLIP